MIKYLKGREDDHIVAQKEITTEIVDTHKTRHNVTLRYFPAEYYNDDIDKEHWPKRAEEWWVEINVGGCFNEMYNQEKTARMSYDLIDRAFCINVEEWHILRNNAEDFRRKFMDLHGLQIFEGKK